MSVSKIEHIINLFLVEDIATITINNWKKKLTSLQDEVFNTVDAIKPMIQFIVATVAPSKIFMLNYNEFPFLSACGFIDLLIVVRGNTPVSCNEIEPILEIPYIRNTKVLYYLHNEESLLKGLKNGHIFYTLNCTKENLVYDDKLTLYPEISQEDGLKLKRQMLVNFNRSFKKAEDFYYCALCLLQNQPSNIIAFMLHQAVELTYRAILSSLNGYDKRTHGIRLLKKHARRCAPQLNNIFQDNSEEETALLTLLESAYLNTRYESDFSIKEADITLLFEKVKSLHIIAKEIVNEKLGK